MSERGTLPAVQPEPNMNRLVVLITILNDPNKNRKDYTAILANKRTIGHTSIGNSLKWLHENGFVKIKEYRRDPQTPNNIKDYSVTYKGEEWLDKVFRRYFGIQFFDEE